MKYSPTGKSDATVDGGSHAIVLFLLIIIVNIWIIIMNKTSKIIAIIRENESEIANI
jgi:hypothetical protein